MNFLFLLLLSYYNIRYNINVSGKNLQYYKELGGHATKEKYKTEPPGKISCCGV